MRQPSMARGTGRLTRPSLLAVPIGNAPPVGDRARAALEGSTSPETRKGRSIAPRLLVGRGLLSSVSPLAFALLVGVGTWVAVGLVAPSGPRPMPTSPAVEERWGVRVSHVGVTGDGGLVEVRFVVLDGDKALALMEERNLPLVRSERSGAVLRSQALMTSHRAVAPGRTSFLLYRNTGGVLRPGSFATLVFGDLELEHVPVE